MRDYLIEDDGNEFHLAVFLNGAQVGNLLMEDGGSGLAFDWCYEIGEQWKKSGSGVSPISLNHLRR